jgi:hypothetical protein
MKRYPGYQFKQSVESLTRKIAADFSVVITSINWVDWTATAGTDQDGEIYFADVADDAVLYDIDVQRYVGFAVHEMLHRDYTDFNVQAHDEYLAVLHNAVEDAWIEHKGIDAGLTGNIGGLLSALVDQIVGEANATVTDWTDPGQYPFIFAVFLRRHSDTFVPVPDGLEPIIHEATRKLDGCKSSADTLKLAEWIRDQLKALPEDTPGKPRKPPSKPPKDDRKGKGAGEAKKRLDGNPHNSPGKAKPLKSEKAVQVEPKMKAPEGKAGAGSWSEDATLSEAKRHIKDAWLTDKPAVSARLSFEVKRLFDNSGREDFQRNRRSGSIDVTALHKIGTTDKLFQRRHAIEGIDSAVVICLDVSGSMFDDGKPNLKYGFSNRIVQATLTTNALLDTLRKAQVATCVLTFGSQTAVIKTFNDNPLKAIEKLKGVKIGGSTNDYFALRYAHKLLLQRPEQRKIAFVITDGIGNPAWVNNQCHVGERLGITTIGVGIEQRVDGIYTNAVHVNDMADLAAVSFKQIKLAA